MHIKTHIGSLARTTVPNKTHDANIQVLQQIVHCSWKTEKNSPEKGSEQY